MASVLIFQELPTQASPCPASADASTPPSPGPGPSPCPPAVVHALVGWVGDCKVVLSERMGQATCLTTDHKPDDPVESARIEKGTIELYILGRVLNIAFLFILSLAQFFIHSLALLTHSVNLPSLFTHSPTLTHTSSHSHSLPTHSHSHLLPIYSFTHATNLTTTSGRLGARSPRQRGSGR